MNEGTKKPLPTAGEMRVKVSELLHRKAERDKTAKLAESLKNMPFPQPTITVAILDTYMVIPHEDVIRLSNTHADLIQLKYEAECAEIGVRPEPVEWDE